MGPSSLEVMRDELHGALDDIQSPRASNDRQTKALKRLEYILIKAVVEAEENSEGLDHFLALQLTFECNITSRLLPWISAATLKLNVLAEQDIKSDEWRVEVSEQAKQFTISLALIQGLVLKHPPSKQFVGRRSSLEILTDLLLASRHLASIPAPSSAASTKSTEPSPSLTSIVLDTLLVILVDSSVALRAFEGCSGVHAIVKILKRAGTPREDRMKCLEFLYFYLLDETQATGQKPATPPPTAPATPLRTTAGSNKPFFATGPRRPLSRYGSSTFSFPPSSDVTNASTSSSPSTFGSSGSTSRSTSSSSSQSFSSTSSNVSASTAPSTRPPTPSSPKKTSFGPGPGPQTPMPKPRGLMMLKKEVDYVPESPLKIDGGDRPMISRRGHSRGKSLSTLSTGPRSGSGAGSGSGLGSSFSFQPNPSPERANKLQSFGGGSPSKSQSQTRGGKMRTTEEKKELLGTLLGNVDALVDGVRKAGIWGLG